MAQRVMAVTVNTDENDNIKVWERTAKVFGYPYTILGMNEKWQGWKWRTNKYLTFLKTLEGQVDIILLLDGNDIFFTGPIDEFIQKFMEMGSPIVIGAESQCCTGKWNIEEVHVFAMAFCKNAAKHTESPYIYPNGGGVFGFYDDVVGLLESIKNESDDQAGYLQQMILNPRRIKLDYNQSIIGNHSHDLDNPDAKNWIATPDRRFQNTLTGEKPVIMHFPGSNKTRFSDYQRMLQQISGKNAKIMELEKIAQTGQFHKSSAILPVLLVTGIVIFIIFLIWYVRLKIHSRYLRA